MEQRPALVGWPEEQARRESLAQAGTPLLLVIAPGASIPALGPGEDWIWRSSDERDVANRLARLGRIRVAGGAAIPPLLPLLTELSVDEHRVATRLLTSIGRMVPTADLPIDDLVDVIARLRPVLGTVGYTVVPVGDAGYLLEHEAPPP